MCPVLPVWEKTGTDPESWIWVQRRTHRPFWGLFRSANSSSETPVAGPPFAGDAFPRLSQPKSMAGHSISGEQLVSQQNSSTVEAMPLGGANATNLFYARDFFLMTLR
jgi:hypothetical protein